MKKENIKVGINGFGRIGKHIFKIFYKNKIPISMINDPFITPEYVAYSLKYDSVYQEKIRDKIDVLNNAIIINGQKITITNKSYPKEIEWNIENIDCVIEASGIFLTMEKASSHNVKLVICTGPSDDIPMYVYGVNHENINTIQDKIIVSGASCTTNCIAPIIHIIDNKYNIIAGGLTTIHGVTTAQKPVDTYHANYRMGRSCFNIIPIPTGATKAIERIFPHLTGKFTGLCFRIPIQDISVADLTLNIKNPILDINEIINDINILKSKYKNIIDINIDLTVSNDFIGSPQSAIFDNTLSTVINNNFIKIICWYDNEYGYANRIFDLFNYIINK